MKKTIYFLIAICFILDVQSQDIATARLQGIGAVVTVSGIVTNGDELGPIRYIEDVTAGLAIYDISTNNYLANTLRGDSITISGTLVDYNGLLEMNPNSIELIQTLHKGRGGGRVAHCFQSCLNIKTMILLGHTQLILCLVLRARTRPSEIQD